MGLRIAWVLLVSMLLSGCSTFRLAYNQAELIAGWMASDYFDLSAEQKDEFRTHFQRLHAWHRATQLVEYAALLEAAQKRIDGGVQADDVAWAIATIKLQYRPIVERSAADAARLLATLTDQQLATTRREFEKGNRKYARDFGASAPPEEQRRLRLKRNLERIEQWTGPLSAAQEARIATLSNALPLVADLRLDDRMRRQREFLALLEGRKRTEVFQKRLRAWLLDWDRTRSPEYEAALATFVNASGAMYVEVFALLTREQRDNVSARLQRYVVAFRELAREAPRVAADEKRG
jgi:hypothetical protein